jgi:hypothetical protein
VGSRSKARARAQASVTGQSPNQGRPPTIAAAVAVVTVQALGVLLAAVLAGIATIEGKSYQNASGIAITAIGVGAAIGLGYVAFGLAKTRRWSRTPALLTQLFTGIIGIYLVQGQRYDWGVPALVLCLAGFVLLLVPPSIRALTGQSSPVSPSRS